MVLSLIEVRLTYIIPSQRVLSLIKVRFTYIIPLKLNRGQTYVYNTTTEVVLSLIEVRLTYIIPSQRWF